MPIGGDRRSKRGDRRQHNLVKCLDQSGHNRWHQQGSQNTVEAHPKHGERAHRRVHLNCPRGANTMGRKAECEAAHLRTAQSQAIEQKPGADSAGIPPNCCDAAMAIGVVADLGPNANWFFGPYPCQLLHGGPVQISLEPVPVRANNRSSNMVD